MKLNKRLLSLVLALFLFAGLFSGCGSYLTVVPARTENNDISGSFAKAKEEDEMTRVQETDRFVLYVNYHNGTAAVEDKKTGETWYTNPEDRKNDGLASGFHKNALLSAITVVYTTSQSVDMTCGGYMSSVSKKGLYYMDQPDGSVIFMFDFPNEGFYIPVKYELTERGFAATVLTALISEYGDNTIKTIDLLPFFGAGGTEDDGYMLVPDGSGALIYYNNQRLTANSYSKALYGFDNGKSDKVSTSATYVVSENQYLPVFGIRRNDNACLAVITRGAPRASINANVAGKYTSYNTVWSTCDFRTVGTVLQTQKDGSVQAVTITERNLETWCDYQVTYCFTDKGANTYADLAAYYRDYLIAEEGLACRTADDDSIPLYLDLYGYIEKTKSFLGIPRQAKITVTSIADVNAILDELNAAGINDVVVKYSFWAKNSFYRKLPVTAKVDPKVGSAAEMAALQTRLAQSGGRLYLSADLLNVYKLGSGVNKYDTVLQSVANTAQLQHEFTLDTSSVDTRYAPWYLLRVGALDAFFGRFTKNMLSAGYSGFALDTIGTTLYSELSTTGTGRNQAMELFRSAVAGTASAAEGILLTGANEYAAVYAADILLTSSKSSGYDLEDVSVPFYQMVFHGYVNYSMGASNLASNPADKTLKCMEYGAYPLFSLVGENVDELISSRLDDIYSADYKNWSVFIQDQYKQINSVLAGVQTAAITGHQILGTDLRMTEYSNGTKVYVNYGDAEAQADGIIVPAVGFAVTVNGSLTVSGTAIGDR